MKSSWHKIAEAPMSWDSSDVERAEPAQRSQKRPPPVPVKPKGNAVRSKLPGVKEAADFDEEVWNVTNRLTGQVFSHVPGKTPIDAKRHVMRSNPRLSKMSLADLAADPAQPKPDAPPTAQGTGPTLDRGERWRKNGPIDTGDFLSGVDRGGQGPNGTEVTGEPQPVGVTGSSTAIANRRQQQKTANLRVPRGTPARGPNDTEKMPPVEYQRPDDTEKMPAVKYRRPADTDGFTDDEAEPPTYVDMDPRRYREGATAGGSLTGYQMPHPEANDEELEEAALAERVFRNMVEIVRKKKGGGGYVLYSPNKGKKKKPRPVGEFPTRSAAKAAELARFPPKDSKELQRARKKVDKIRKDPKARARAERNDLTGRKKLKKSGAPARDRHKAKREELTRALATNIREVLFHEDELPGSPWDERIAAMSPDHVAGDRKLAAFHKKMHDASVGSLGKAGKFLSRVLRGVAKVRPGDVTKDVDANRTFMPVMLDVGGTEVGPLHLYIDGGHVKIELAGGARQQISELDPDLAGKLRGGLVNYEQDHLPKISDARDAWMERDKHLDGVHAKIEKHVSGMSDVERHLAKQLLKVKREN